MCEAISLSTLAAYAAIAGAAASAVSVGVQQDQMRSQSNKTRDATLQAAQLQVNDLQRQRDQQQAAGTAQMNEAARKAAHDEALFDVVAGEYGGGHSVDRALAVSGIQSSEQLATISDNTQTAQGEASFHEASLLSQANSRLASIQRPSAFGSGLQILGNTASAATNYYASTRVPQR